MFVHARIAVSALLCALILPAHAAENVRWEVVKANGVKVGHVRITRNESDTGIVETEDTDIRLGKSARRVHYLLHVVTETAPDASLRRMVREVVASEGHSRIEARAEGDDLVVTRDFGKSRDSERLAGAARGLQTEECAREWLSAAARGKFPPPFRFRTWDPVKGTAIDVELSIRPREGLVQVERRVTSPRGTTASYLRVADPGWVVQETMSMGAYEFERSGATEKEALAANGVFDHVAALLDKSPYRIPSRDMDQKIRYRFENRGVAAILPTGAGQRTWSEGTTTWVQVCASCPLDAQPLSPEDRARALAPTSWLESTDEKLARRARNLTEGIPDPAKKMQRLAGFVRGYMSSQVDMLGYGTALQALHSRRGDCTEFAVLVAALGRAAGVPTRIAIGQVYARRFEGYRHVFVPHSWVQAWTGTGWQSFDAAIGTFDSTHLAFAVSYDGDPWTHYSGISLANQLDMKDAARVVPRKTASN